MFIAKVAEYSVLSWRDATPPLLDVVVADVVVEAFYDATRVYSVIAFFEDYLL